jgi:peptidoglycan/LPS O-acetylase OafA/YrhL
MIRHNVAIDYLRAFVVVLVLVHHSVIAYSPYARFDPVHYLWGAPIVDTAHWRGFDLLVLFDDNFFMSLMFFLSGLFVWPALARKGCGAFLRDRILRLALPFAIMVTVLMPVAYYPAFRMTGADPGFLAFWRQCISVADWPAGPAWFIWLLFAFDCIAAGLYKVAPGAGAIFGRLASRSFSRPLMFFVLLVALSAPGYLVMLSAFGPTRWLALGPFSLQASRLLLYFTYFVAGIAVGAVSVDQDLLAKGGRLARRWLVWLFAALAFFCLVVVLEVAHSKGLIGSSPFAWQTFYGFAFVLSCATTTFAFLAFFLRFASEPVRAFDALRDNSYGMYLIHYIFVIWLQYELLAAPLHPVAKAAIVITGTLTLSFAIVAAFRGIPAVARIV